MSNPFDGQQTPPPESETAHQIGAADEKRLQSAREQWRNSHPAGGNDPSDQELLDWLDKTERTMASHRFDPQVHKLLLQSWVAGAAGIISGGLLFFFWLQSHDPLWKFLLGLTGAGVMSFVIEWFREIIREGKGELEDKARLLPAAVLTFLTLVMLEVFVMASDHTLKLDPQIYANSLRVFLGENYAPNLPPAYGLVGLAMIWIAMGVTVTQGLSAIILAAKTGQYQSQPIGFSLRQGLRCLLASILAMLVALLGFRLLVMLAIPDAARKAYDFLVQPDLPGWLSSIGLQRLFGVLALPVIALVGIWHALFHWMSWFILPAAGVVVVALLAAALTLIGRLTGLPAGTSVFDVPFLARLTGRFKRLHQGNWLDTERMGALATRLVFVLALPLLLIGWRQVFELIWVTAYFWLAPCLVVSAIVPRIRDLTRPPSLRVLVSLVVSGLVLVSVLFIQRLAEYKWILVPPGVVFLGAGLIGLFINSSSLRTKELWPVVPLVVAALVFLSTAVAQTAISALIGNLHALMSLDPPVRVTPRFQSAVSGGPINAMAARRLEHEALLAQSATLADQLKTLRNDVGSTLYEARELIPRPMAKDMAEPVATLLWKHINEHEKYIADQKEHPQKQKHEHEEVPLKPKNISKAVEIVGTRFPNAFHVAPAGENDGHDHGHPRLSDAVVPFGKLDGLQRQLAEQVERSDRLREQLSPPPLPDFSKPIREPDLQPQEQIPPLPEPAKLEELREAQAELALELRTVQKFLDVYQSESRAARDELRRQMADYFHLFMAAGFAFWAALSILAGWERMYPSHSAH